MTGLLVVAHFVCPLLFFTDLTRNPYFTQIALLNVSVMAAAAWFALSHAWGRAGDGPALRLPRTPLDAPIAAWLAVCAATWTLAYFGHAPFFRESMRAEGLRVFLFTVVNTVLPYYLACAVARNESAQGELPLARWAVFAVVWAGGWAVFRELRTPTAGMLDVWSHIWDGYGALLWGAGFATAWWLTRKGGFHDFWHLALTVGFVSAVYGIFQYLNMEWIWPKVLNPYGGRSVSTFGNPNFMSSYYVLLLPVALAYYLDAVTNARRAVYGAVILAMEGALLCSLTRSSWAGAVAAIAVLALAPGIRERLKAGMEMHGLLATASVAMIVLWPQSAVSGYTPSVFGRVSELGLIFDKAGGGTPYSPLYQRVLIWSCAWLMGHENFLLGKGWGLFELFYPFYQGHMLTHYGFFSGMRTHANNSHNEILELFAQTGLAGVGVNLWLWAVFFLCVWRWWRPRGSESRPGALWGWAATAGAAGMLVDNLLNVSMHFAVPAFLLWWQAGTAMGRVAPAEGGWRTLRLPASAAKAGALAAAALAVLGANLWWRQWNREVQYFLGFKLMRAGRLSAAVERLEAAYRWHPREVNSNYELGNAYARSENFAKAAWAYGEALNANAGYDEIYFNRGTVLTQRLNRPDEGLDYFRTAFSINPTSYEIMAALSGSLLREPEKNRDETIAVLERAVHVFPNDPGFRNNLGTLYNRKGDRARALQEWTEALRRSPELPQAEQNLLALVRLGSLKPPEILGQVALYRELESKIGAKDYSPATLQLARRVSEAFPQAAKVRYYRGNLELLHGDPQKALELIEPLAQADPRQAGLQLNLGQVYARLGKKAEAAEAFRRALAAEPGNQQARQALQALGQPAPSQ